MRGGCRQNCDLDARGRSLPLAALFWMQGGCRTISDLDFGLLQSSYLPSAAAAQRTKSSYSPPCRGYEATVALPAAMEFIGGRRRNTCRLAVDARRLSSYLPPRRGCEAALVLPAALTIFGDRSRRL